MGSGSSNLLNLSNIDFSDDQNIMYQKEYRDMYRENLQKILQNKIDYNYKSQMNMMKKEPIKGQRGKLSKQGTNYKSNPFRSIQFLENFQKNLQSLSSHLRPLKR